MLPWRSVSIFRALPGLELLHVLCVSRTSSWSLRGRWRFLRGVLVVFDMVDAPGIHEGSFIEIFRSLPSWKVVQLLDSSMESKRTLVVPERSLCGFWRNGCPNDTSRKLHINFLISTFLKSAPSPRCLQSVIMESKRTLEVPDRSLSGFWHGGCLKVTSRKLFIDFQIF